MFLAYLRFGNSARVSFLSLRPIQEYRAPPSPGSDLFGLVWIYLFYIVYLYSFRMWASVHNYTHLWGSPGYVLGRRDGLILPVDFIPLRCAPSTLLPPNLRHLIPTVDMLTRMTVMTDTFHVRNCFSDPIEVHKLFYFLLSAMKCEMCSPVTSGRVTTIWYHHVVIRRFPNTD